MNEGLLEELIGKLKQGDTVLIQVVLGYKIDDLGGAFDEETSFSRGIVLQHLRCRGSLMRLSSSK